MKNLEDTADMIPLGIEIIRETEKENGIIPEDPAEMEKYYRAHGFPFFRAYGQAVVFLQDYRFLHLEYRQVSRKLTEERKRMQSVMKRNNKLHYISWFMGTVLVAWTMILLAWRFI